MVTNGRIKVTRCKQPWPDFIQKYRFHPDVVSILNWDGSRIVCFRAHSKVDLDSWVNRFRKEVGADCSILNPAIVEVETFKFFAVPPAWLAQR